jgi:hypothetical protein
MTTTSINCQFFGQSVTLSLDHPKPSSETRPFFLTDIYIFATKSKWLGIQPNPTSNIQKSWIDFQFQSILIKKTIQFNNSLYNNSLYNNSLYNNSLYNNSLYCSRFLVLSLLRRVNRPWAATSTNTTNGICKLT